jgi:hypothetical protein
MRPTGTTDHGAVDFESKPVPCRESGRYGYTVRVLPHHAGLPTGFLPGLIVWAEAPEAR